MLEIRRNIRAGYSDIFTPQAIDALHALAPLDDDRTVVLARRTARREARARPRQRIAFLDPSSEIPRTRIRVQAARDGAFNGSEIPVDLQRQWIRGTGPGARPGVPTDKSIRNIAYAVLSGADGWMFDGEDALGQLSTMSLDNQRCRKMAIDRAPQCLRVAEAVAAEMNRWGEDFFNHRIVEDWQAQLGFTTKLF